VCFESGVDNGAPVGGVGRGRNLAIRQWLTDVAPVGQAALQTVSGHCYRPSGIKYLHELTAIPLVRLFASFTTLCQQMKLHSVYQLCD
jgi:hypothetical protein